jgi:hypothetical protein
MQEAVEQRAGHGVADAALGGGIARGKHRPAVGEPVVAKRTVENKLIAGGLRHRGRGGQLIEKENAFAASGEEIWRDPFRAVVLDSRQTAEVDGIKLDGAYVNKFALQMLCNLLNELGFPDATSAPDMERNILRNCGNQRLNKVRRFHEYCPLIRKRPTEGGWDGSVMSWHSRLMGACGCVPKGGEDGRA